jgi:hypothetical protein
MKHLSPLCVVFLAACPGPTNPHELWIAPNGAEAELKLVDQEPDPF